eukprot:TRINITY_DN9765_c0_g1_i2.p1 TRINITY_DN9765_c0_g1~~TRINITY_DN9765_c0_g1_i2.p1  ORF type:complete len:1188 (+),score=227.80 TRINITY_DN9765_c0_g1_i2:326-3565(+)
MAIEPSRLVPQDIFQNVWEENMNFLRDKNVFDIDYFAFLWSVVYLDTSSPLLEYIHPSTINFHPTMRSIELGTRFIIETLAHAKEKQNLKLYVEHLQTLYAKHTPACIWFLETLADPSCSWLRQMLLVCIISETREAFANLVISVMFCLARFEREAYAEEENALLQQKDVAMEIVEVKDDEVAVERNARRSKSYIVQVVDALMELIKDAPNYWRNFPQFFLPLRAFASWGSVERQYFMTRNTISQLIDFYLADESPTIKNAQPKSKRIRMGDKASSPNVSFMVDIISTLVRGSATNVHKEFGVPPTQIQDGAIIAISTEDMALLHCPTFYQRIIKEAANIPATIEIVTHLCWENEDTSKTLIEVITSGINHVEYEYFKSYFEVFTALLDVDDSKRKWRVSLAMELYLVVIADNLQFKNATYHSIKFLVDLSTKNADVRSWLFDNKPKFLDSWLLSSNAEAIRSVTEELVHTLIPEVPAVISLENEELIILQEGRQKLQNLYQYLLSLLPRASCYSKGEIEPATKQGEETIMQWKLTSYFRLLKWCVIGQLEKQIFFHYATEFISLFFTIDQYQMECDENKKEATALWYHVLKDSPDNIGIILNHDFYPRRLFDYWISLKGVAKFIEYNNSALPAFYNILLLCSEQEAFRKKLSVADNFAWAIRHMLLSNEYLPVAAVLAELVKKCTEYPEFRTKQIENSILKDKIVHAPKQLVAHLEQLLLTSEDCGTFCEHGGLDLLCQLLERRGETKDRITDEQKAAISILIHVTGFILAQLSRPKQKMTDFVHSWETRNNALFALVQLLDVTLDDLAVNSCYKLIENIVQLDSACLEKLLLYLAQEHEDMFVRVNNPTQQIPKRNRLHLRVHHMIEEGVTDGVKFRYVDTYYHFVYKICNIALNQLGTKQLPTIASLAAMIGIETTRFESMTCMMTSLFTKLFEFDAFKQLPLLDFYVTKILTKDVHLLNKPEVFAFFPKLFAQTQSRLPEGKLQSIISAQSDRVRALENVESADDSVLANYLMTLKAFAVIMTNNSIKNYYTQVNKLLLSKVIEIGSNEQVLTRLNATSEAEVVNSLIRSLKEIK